jgi:hypothetical protein
LRPVELKNGIWKSLTTMALKKEENYFNALNKRLGAIAKAEMAY